jgi:Family of unknown function (DUF6491)
MRTDALLRQVFTATAAMCLVAALPSVAPAAQTAAAPTRTACFSIHQWNGWHAPNPSLLYVRVGVSDIWRIDLNSPCNTLRDPSAHLVTRVRGSDQVCSAIELDLGAQGSGGFSETCFVKDIHKLTPEEAKALDRKDRP